MLTESEIEAIRSNMLDEHKRDLEAFEALKRLSRFLPNSGNTLSRPVGSTRVDHIRSTQEPSSMAPADSMLGKMERILWGNPSRTWTIQAIKAEMEKDGYRFLATQPIASMGVAMKKLVDRGKVDVVMRGSGRTPNIYQWKVMNTKTEENVAEDLL
jgi:hypothetical protein